MFKIFIGWDSTEPESAEVCKFSILQHSTLPVDIQYLKIDDLRKSGVYTRSNDNDSTTEHTFTRFLVPHLCEYNGWAIYVDSDFLFTSDVRELFQQIDDNIAVSVVKHHYSPANTVKKGDKPQHQYPRKNWSSLMLFNCSHPALKKLTPLEVSTQSAQVLHRLDWIEDQKTIGSLPKEWNWLVNWYHEPDDGAPKALHYTEGGPWLPACMKTEYGAQWLSVYHKWLESNRPIVQPSVFDTAPSEIKTLFQGILAHRVDPAEQYYPGIKDLILTGIKKLNNQAVFAVEADTMDEINSKHQNKGKDYDPFLKSFIQGSGGQITVWDKVEKSTTPIVVRGVTKRKQMAACHDAGRDYYYIDTGYFGNGRKKLYHRITKNNMQNLGPIIHRPRDRLAATGFRARKFRPGSNILLAPPSQKLLAVYNIDSEQWIQETTDRLRLFTDRNIIVREKAGRSTRVTTDTIEMALERDVHCLVTFSSIAAVEAVLYGKPAIVLGPSAAHHVCSTDCRDIENPLIPTLEQVEEWAAHLAYCQFTENEMRDGTAWQILNDQT